MSNLYRTLLRKRGIDTESGFTLAELLIVIVIIGILAAIAVPIFTGQQAAALAATVKSDTRSTVVNVATALVTDPTTQDLATVGVAPVISENNVIYISGSYADYIVTGCNPDIGFTFTYTYSTGQYTEGSNPDCAPANGGGGDNDPPGDGGSGVPSNGVCTVGDYHQPGYPNVNEPFMNNPICGGSSAPYPLSNCVIVFYFWATQTPGDPADEIQVCNHG